MTDDKSQKKSPKPKNPLMLEGCESTNHSECFDYRGEEPALWQCEKCRRWFCYAEGTTIDPELCDDCWVEKQTIGDEKKPVKKLKQKVAEIDFRPYPPSGEEADLVAYEGNDRWWFMKTRLPNLFSVMKGGTVSELGGYSFFTDVNGRLQPAKMVDKDTFETVEYG